jgi:hypothetical protein
MITLLKEQVRNIARATRRALRMSPMSALMREIRQRGVDPRGMDALECFAFTGAMHTLDYARSVKTLELWEITPIHEAALRKRFPRAMVRMTDTYQEVARRDRRFDLIVVDNSPVHGGHHEHFDLFPGIFRLMQASCTVVLDVIPTLHGPVRFKYPEMLRPDTLAARMQFYGVDAPEKITEEAMVSAYADRAERNGYRIDWYFFRKRNPILTYLVLHLVRIGERVSADAQSTTTHLTGRLK